MSEQFKSLTIPTFSIILVLALLAQLKSFAGESEDRILSKEELIKDTRQLVELIETVHPQPYGDKGGKIAFHRQYHRILQSLPEKGLSAKDYYRLVSPLVALVQDGHTRIFPPWKKSNSNMRLPLSWGIVEKYLYIKHVFSADLQPLLAAVLLEVNGIPTAELVKRQSRLVGAENSFGNMKNLADKLRTRAGLIDLIPESMNSVNVLLSVQLMSGETRILELAFCADLPDQPIAISSTIEIPGDRNPCPQYGFLDHTKNTAILSLNNLVAYREAFEAFNATGYKQAEEWARFLYKQIQKKDPGRKAVVRLQKTGVGRYYYATRLSYAPASLKKDPINAGIEIKREYSAERNGRWVLLDSPMQIERGELVRVDIFLSLPNARNFVVVDDPVPGGLEPVNRDLATASTVDADKGAYQPSGGSWWFRYSDWSSYGVSRWSFYHQEMRHHSVRFYSDYLPAGNYHLSYTAQAIAPGEFTVLPVHAEEMYDPDVFGKGEPTRLTVSRD